jgi:hypothetical protein
MCCDLDELLFSRIALQIYGLYSASSLLIQVKRIQFQREHKKKMKVAAEGEKPKSQ